MIAIREFGRKPGVFWCKLELPVSYIENIYESFFYNSLDGIIIFDTKGDILNLNLTARELFGIPLHLNSLNMNELIDEKYQPEFWDICQSLVAPDRKSRKRNKMVMPHNRADERRLVLGIHLNNHIPSESGPLIAAVIVDETLRWRERHELRQSHLRFRQIFQHNPVAQIILRVCDHTIVDANAKFLQLFNFKMEDIIARSVEENGLEHYNECRKKLHYEPADADGVRQCETTATTHDGKYMHVSLSYVNIKMHDEPHEVWSIIDISSQKEAEENLKKINEHLERKVRQRTQDLTNMLEREKILGDLKSRFVSMASHEFRTPLTTILASAGLLENHIVRNDLEKCARHIGRIRSSVKLLTEILEDFLSLDKIEQGLVKPNIATFNLKDLADNIIQETELTLKKGQKIMLDTDSIPEVKQDINLLKNTMLNLLSNAIKYSGEGKTIVLSMKANDHRILIQVSDQGIGIPDEDQPHIFSRFFRARNSEVYQGTGLGLNIVKKYVELMHGKINFVSKENVGTTFTVEVPVMS